MRRPYNCIATYINASVYDAHTDTAIPPIRHKGGNNGIYD